MDAFRQDLLYALRVLAKDRAYSAGRHPHARRLPRRQHRHLHRRPFRAAPAAALSRVAPAALAVRRLPRRRRRARGHVGAELRRPAGDDRRVLVGRPLYASGATRSGRERAPRTSPAMNVTPSFFEVLGATAARGRLVRGGRRHARQEQGRAPQPHVCGAAAGRHRRHRRTPVAAGRRGLRRRRRAARDVLLPEPGDPRVRAAGVHARGVRARTAAGARTTSCWRGSRRESRSNGPRPGSTHTTPP